MRNFRQKSLWRTFFLESNVNSENYLEMLKQWFWPKHLRTAEYKKYYFQQDGARPHTSNVVQAWLGEKFEEKAWLKEKWPTRSPDLNPCDFFLWGYLKQRVYSPLPKNVDELKANIEREVR